MANEARVLDALGDPTRRKVFELLADGERHVSAITQALPVTQSAVSQHLKVLKDAGLIADRAEGTRRLYRIERNGLEALRSYVDRFWDDVLDSFASFAEAEPSSPPTPVRTEGRVQTTDTPERVVSVRVRPTRSGASPSSVRRTVSPKQTKDAS